MKNGQVKRILNCNGHIVKNILYLLCQVEMQIHLVAREFWEKGSKKRKRRKQEDSFVKIR